MSLKSNNLKQKPNELWIIITLVSLTLFVAGIISCAQAALVLVNLANKQTANVFDTTALQVFGTCFNLFLLFSLLFYLFIVIFYFLMSNNKTFMVLNNQQACSQPKLFEDMSLIMDNLDTCVAIYKDEDLKLVYANAAYLKQSGTSLPNIVNKSIKLLYPQLEDFFNTMDEVMRTGKPVKLKEFKYPFGGTYDKWWDVQIFPYKQNNSACGVVSISNEITEQIKSRIQVHDLAVKLEEKVMELNTIVECLPIGLTSIDNNKNVVYVNKHILKYLSNCPIPCSLETYLRKLEVKNENGEPIYFEGSIISLALQGIDTYDKIVILQDKSTGLDVYVRVSTITTRDKNGEIKGCILLAQDDTDHITSAETISEQRNLLKSIFEQIPMGLALYKHPEMTVVDVNGAYLTFTKPLRSTDHIIGLKPTEFISDWMSINSKASDSQSQATTKKRKKSSIRTPMCIGSRYYDVQSRPIIENGAIKYWLEISNDVTQQVKYTKDVEEVSKIKEELFANISHEFRTPLTVILGTLQLMSKMYEDIKCDYASREFKYIKTMKQNCFRLLKLINNLLDITRVDSGYLTLNLENYNIVNIVEEITLSISNFANQRGIELEFDTSLEEIIMAVDIDKFERIMLNLLSNSIKFTNRGGKISVYVCEAGKNIQITVRDTGIGIPKDKQALIFERFVQVDNLLNRKQEGSGIGLSLVKSLIELHNGKITVNSEEGKGSEFVITLPVKMGPNKETYNSIEQNRPYKVLDSTDIEFSDIYETA